MAASNAATVFSTMPFAASCSPRCAIGFRKAERSRMACLSGRSAGRRRPRRRSRAAGSDTPTATRVWRPLSPRTSTIRSEAPFITCGCSVNSGAALTKPFNRTICATRSRLPIGGLCLGENVQGAKARCRAPFDDRHSAAKPARDNAAVGRLGNLAGYKQKVAGKAERHVIGDWVRRIGQRDTKRRKTRLDLIVHAAILPPRWPARRPLSLAFLTGAPHLGNGVLGRQVSGLNLSGVGCAAKTT